MEGHDVLVIGGSAAGIVAATTTKSFYPDKSVLLVRKEHSVMVPCGIPYIFGTLEGCGQNQIPDAAVTNAGVALQETEITSVDLESKVCTTDDGRELGFDKLVFATGSTPKEPAWLPGATLNNVYVIPKDRVYLEHLLSCLPDMTNIVVMGAGFIGVKVADELGRSGKNVTLVETLPHVLGLAFDAEFAARAEEILSDRGITLRMGTTVEKLDGEDSVTGVILEGGERLEADAVVLAVGYVPNTSLAEQAGCELNKFGFIEVDEYMRTENADVFAVGDCAEKSSFITRTPKPLMLASTACAEARIAAMNLFRISTVRCFGGTISIFSTAIGGDGFGAAGVTENLARERGFETLTATWKDLRAGSGLRRRLLHSSIAGLPRRRLRIRTSTVVTTTTTAAMIAAHRPRLELSVSATFGVSREYGRGIDAVRNALPLPMLQRVQPSHLSVRYACSLVASNRAPAAPGALSEGGRVRRPGGVAERGLLLPTRCLATSEDG